MFRRFVLAILVTAIALAVSAEVIKVKEVTRDKLDKQVTVAGTVTDFTASRSDRAPNSFTLKDETGEIRLAIWPDQLNPLPAKEKLNNGAAVQVTGKVAEFRGKMEVHVEETSGIVVGSQNGGAPQKSGGTGAPVQISNINEQMMGKQAEISGTVSSVRQARSETAPHIIKVNDGSGSIDMVFWAKEDELKNVKMPKVGDSVSANGKVDKYRETLQIRLASGSDIRIAPAGSTAAPVASATGEVVKINTIDNKRAGQTVTIEGLVSSARAPRIDTAPYMLKITDDTATIDVVFWKKTADQLKPEQKVEVGNRARITGKVGEHRGTIQLQVEDPSGIQKTAAGANAASTPVSGTQAEAKRVQLGEVSGLADGARVEIEGSVKTVEKLRFGSRLQLGQNGTAVSVLLWDSAEGLKPDVRFVKEASKVTLRGVVRDEAGKKVVVVTKPEEVVSVQL